MKSFWRDLRYAARALSSNRLFALMVVLPLGLAIGATTAVFSFVDAVILRPLPYRNPDQLVLLWASKSKEVTRGISGPDLADLRSQNQVFEGIAAYFGYSGEPINFGPDSSRAVRGFYVGSGVFSVLGVQPHLGRTFRAEEDQPGAPKVAVISHSFWTGEFGADRGVIGRTITLGGEPYTVVGVMPPEFFFPDQTVQVWLPILPALIPADRSAMSVHAVARLKPGVTLARAQGDVDTIVRRLASTYPTDRALSIGVFPFVDQIVGSYRTAFWTLFGGVALLLLIACANVAHLLLARGLRRSVEISVRVTLGATRGAILRQLVAESLLLGLAGGATGIFIACWGVHILQGLTLTEILRFDQAGVDWRTLLFALAVSLLAGLLVGILPALRASRPNLVESLKQGGTAYLQGTRSHLRDLLMVSEITLAFVLVAGAGLLINSFVRLARLDWGFRLDHLLVAEVTLWDSKFPEDIPRNVALTQQVVARLKALPGVQSVAAARGMGLWAAWPNDVSTDGKNSLKSLLSLVGPGYFETLGIPVLRGRGFTERDSIAAPKVAVVSRTLAARLWPRQDPLGKRLFVLAAKPETIKRRYELYRAGKFEELIKLDNDVNSYYWTAYDVVGEAAPALTLGPLQTDTSATYLDYRQRPPTFPMIQESFILRTSTPPAGLIKAAHDAIQSVGGVKVYKEDTLEERMRTAMGGHASNRLLLVVSSVTSGLALALAALGIYGVLAFTTALRTHEIGVRIALGARRREIFRMILGRGLLLTFRGLLFGSLGAILATKTLTGYLFGITPTDPATFAEAALLFLFVAFLACYIPARRATKVDPMVALRYE